MSKWDQASAIINDVRAVYNRAHQALRKYGLEHTHDNLKAFSLALQEGRVPTHLHSPMSAMWRDWAPMAFWNKYKQVYTMHPGLTRELRATDTDTKVNSSVFAALPHPDPMFVLPKGVELSLNDGKPGRLVAFHVCGAITPRPGEGVYVSTSDPLANGLYLNAITEVYSEEGTMEGWDYCHISFPVGETFTIGQLINENRPRLSYDSSTTTMGYNNESELAYSQQVTGIALSHLLYAVSRNADMQSPRNTTTRTSDMTKQLGGVPNRPIKHQPVGYVVGAALEAHRRAEHPEHPERTAATPGGTSRTVRPHVRQAHFHTVRYGPGKQQSYVDWFPPIPVNVNGTMEKPTIHGY